MNEPTVYIVLLNQGWNKVELTSRLVDMTNTKGMRLLFEDPRLAQEKPTSNNRNKAHQRYLKTKCDFLMMLDADITPINHNPAELALADEDIIGCPYRTRNKAGELLWGVYKRINGIYRNVDIDKIKDSPDLFAVDAVVTGCIIIKRRVLEKIKVPFEDIFDENGERIRGHDIEFCRKAKEAGFEVYTTPKRRCEHFKCVGVSGLEESIKKQCKE